MTQRRDPNACWDTCRLDPDADFTGINVIFGYGSICWKPPCGEEHIVRSFPATIKGFVRRLWISSTDHRGTPDEPGYVAMLIPASHPDVAGCTPDSHVVTGRAYIIRDIDAILPELDFRERNGYTRTVTDLFDPKTGEPLGKAIVYVVDTSACPAYTGPVDDSVVASTVATAVGPSGRNSEYVRNLHKYAHEVGCPCPYLNRIVEECSKCEGGCE